MRHLRPVPIAAALLLAATAGCARNSIVGKWTGAFPAARGTSVQMNVEFKPDGTETQTLQAAGRTVTINATYTAKDGVLTETILNATSNGRTVPGGNRTETFGYKLDGDTLALSQPNNSAQLLLKRQ